jgi:hypothetical protein
MHDPSLYPRLPSFGSMFVFGPNDTDKPIAASCTPDQLTQAMQESIVKTIHAAFSDDPQE